MCVLKWEDSQLTIPYFHTLSTCSLRGLCCVFLWTSAAGYWPTGLLLGKPPPVETKKNSSRETESHQKAAFSSAFYPVCMRICVSVPQEAAQPRRSRHKSPSCRRSFPRSNPHALTPPHISVSPLPQGPSGNPSHHCCLFHRRFQNDARFLP